MPMHQTPQTLRAPSLQQPRRLPNRFQPFCSWLLLCLHWCLASLCSDYVLDKGRSTWRRNSCDIVRCSMLEQLLNFIVFLSNAMSVFVTSVRALASQVDEKEKGVRNAWVYFLFEFRERAHREGCQLIGFTSFRF